MSFIADGVKRPSYQPGWFLAEDEGCVRITKTIPATGTHVSTAADGAKYAKMGTFISSLGGILYEDVDLSTGAMPGSIVVAGHYYADRVIGTVSGVATLVSAGNAPTVTRPEGAEGATGATGATQG